MPAAPPRCLRCGKPDSSPRRFLLTCFSCARSWHHRCHIPPVTDRELISRLKATLHNYANSLSGWRCRRCTNNPRLTAGTASRPIEVPDSPPPSTISLPVDTCLPAVSYHPEASTSTHPQIRQETLQSPATELNASCEISRNERETSPVDLTSLSDYSPDKAPHFSGLSIDDISQANDSTMGEVIVAADESGPGEFFFAHLISQAVHTLTEHLQKLSGTLHVCISQFQKLLH